MRCPIQGSAQSAVRSQQAESGSPETFFGCEDAQMSCWMLFCPNSLNAWGSSNKALGRFGAAARNLEPGSARFRVPFLKVPVPHQLLGFSHGLIFLKGLFRNLFGVILGSLEPFLGACLRFKHGVQCVRKTWNSACFPDQNRWAQITSEQKLGFLGWGETNTTRLEAE